MAYKELPLGQKQGVANKLPRRFTPNDLEVLLSTRDSKDNTEYALLLCVHQLLIEASPQHEHSGADSSHPIDPTQTVLVDKAIKTLKYIVEEHVCKGGVDHFIKKIFPEKPGLVIPAWGTSAVPRVKELFELSLQSLERLRHDNKISIDADSYALMAGALSNEKGIRLSVSFFTQGDDDRVATLAHESTHTIQNEKLRTDDKGGYIGTAEFDQADFEKRLKNAAHFEAVIRLILGQKRERPAPNASGEAVKEVTTLLREAWTKGLNYYRELRVWHMKGEVPKDKLERYRALTHLFGIAGYKTAVMNKPSLADLSSAETRVAYLGWLLSRVGPSATALSISKPDFDKGNLIEALVALGSIRQNPKKTIAMIEALADLNKYPDFINKYPPLKL